MWVADGLVEGAVLLEYWRGDGDVPVVQCDHDGIVWIVGCGCGACLVVGSVVGGVLFVNDGRWM